MMWTKTFFSALATAALLAAPGYAETFRAVKDESTFRSLVDGRALTRLGIRLNVTPEGQIVGKAFGRKVTGAWTWSEDGYFCRDLYYGKKDMGPNCQLVQVQGETLRFTSDRGEGIFADLYLR